MDVYRGTELVQSSRVSTGKKGYATPSGIFSILQKKKWHRSNIYSGAPMPYMQRLTWSGIALHAGYVPNRPASHGCIRLPRSFATRLFRSTNIGTHVVVVRDAAAPELISHPALFHPLKPAETVASSMPADAAQDLETESAPAGAASLLRLAGIDEAEAAMARADATEATSAAEPTAVAVAKNEPSQAIPDQSELDLQTSDSPLRILITRRTGQERIKDIQRLLIELRYNPGEVDGYMGPETAAAIKAFQENHNLPANGMVYREFAEALHSAAGKGQLVDGHIYVRQDFKHVLDVPIRLRGGDKPLGDHLFAVKQLDRANEHAQWMVLTPEDETSTSAREALNRVEIPDDIRRRIGSLLTPGSSLIISDRGLSKETFPKGTDFVVLTK